MKLSLKEARESKGITQKFLAKKLGVSVQSLSNWENGKKEVKPIHLLAICQVLGYKEGEIEQKKYTTDK